VAQLIIAFFDAVPHLLFNFTFNFFPRKSYHLVTLIAKFTKTIPSIVNWKPIKHFIEHMINTDLANANPGSFRGAHDLFTERGLAATWCTHQYHHDRLLLCFFAFALRSVIDVHFLIQNFDQPSGAPKV